MVDPGGLVHGEADAAPVADTEPHSSLSQQEDLLTDVLYGW